MPEPKLPHIFLSDPPQQFDYTSNSSGGRSPNVMARSRADHSAYIRRKLNEAWELAKAQSEQRTAVALSVKSGTYLEFEGAPGFDLDTKRLENRPAKIRLLNVRKERRLEGREEVTKATVYIPAGKESFFMKKVNEYAQKTTRPDSDTPKNASLINSIEDIRLAVVESFWQDSPSLMPRQSEKVWCEVWLRGDEEVIEAKFRELAQGVDLTVQAGVLRFPERTVVLVKSDNAQLAELIDVCEFLAEFRRAKETGRFFLDLKNVEQTEWVISLLERLEVDESSLVAISVLDTGANNGHPLLSPILVDNDCHTFSPNWGTYDHDGHGTLMCGLAGYGDLQQALETSDPVSVPYHLESVKILPPQGNNDKDLYGFITKQSVSYVEIEAPESIHLYCMAVTSEDTRDRGRPTSWSAAIDSISSGYEDSIKRLLIVSAGNVVGASEWRRYPESNYTNSVHDPAQSWNALSVGAYTEKTTITESDLSDYTAIAPAGGLSPFSTTSLTWERKKWPCKPDIVLEGGNIACDPSGFPTECKDLSLLSTSHKHTLHQFDWINMTSAATAQASAMAAQIQSHYPDAWPETIRALMVHSAQWTPEMEAALVPSESKTNRTNLLRACGYGVPNLGVALNCAANRLTLVAEKTIRPFDKKIRGSGYRTRDMHLHELPWPRDILLSLGEVEVSMRITLSYFIEPGPGEIGWKDRYRYASHAFRFDLINIGETNEQFKKRLSKAAREEGEKAETKSGSERWLIGPEGRNLGSLHSDIWKGTAADLAACNVVGITPVIGWWRERAWLNRWNRVARYSLVVSLHTPEEVVDQKIDIYTPIATRIGVPVEIWAE
ncbi:MAG: S8 family peptidase [Desulfovibrio sp.]|uniref:S8 family peptidase n=1 Tax=Desulfovibrio sp. 7SRBS1 TaxID=3378064 RepID=UPI003B40C5AE